MGRVNTEIEVDVRSLIVSTGGSLDGTKNGAWWYTITGKELDSGKDMVVYKSDKPYSSEPLASFFAAGTIQDILFERVERLENMVASLASDTVEDKLGTTEGKYAKECLRNIGFSKNDVAQIERGELIITSE